MLKTQITAQQLYAKLAIDDLGGVSDAFLPSGGAYGVDIWNLFDASGNECQSQLGLVPEPPTVAFLILGGCLALLITRKRK